MTAATTRRLQAAGAGVAMALALPGPGWFPLVLVVPGLLRRSLAGTRGWGAFRTGWLAGFAQWVVAVAWVYIVLHRYGHLAAPIALLAVGVMAAILALGWGLVGWLTSLTPERWRPWLLPLTLTSFELVHHLPPWIFPWNPAAAVATAWPTLLEPAPQGSVVIEVPDALEKFGSDMNYILATNEVPGGNINNLAPAVQAQYRDFLKRYELKYKQKMASEASIVYTAAIVLFDHILPAAGSDDPDKLAKVCHEISLPYTMTARPAGLKFSAADAELANQNLRASTMVRQLYNGKFYAVWRKEIAEIKQLLKSSRLVVAEEYDHFELKETLANPYGPYGQAVMSQIFP